MSIQFATGLGTIAAYRFGLLGDEEHKMRSYANITTGDLYNGNQPVTDGVYDPRLGTTEHRYSCVTCKKGRKECLGHPGHTVLKLGVTDPIGIAEVRRWLRICCFGCGAPLVDLANYQHLPKSRRLIEAGTASTEHSTCRRCHAVHPKIVKDEEDYFTFRAQYKDKTLEQAEKLMPHTIRKYFDRIADETVLALGRTLNVHPRKWIHTLIQVPPVTIRPGVRSMGGGAQAASYHDLTNMIQQMVSRNILLPDEAKLAQLKDEDLKSALKSVENLNQTYFEMIYGTGATAAANGKSSKRSIMSGSKAVASILRRMPRKQGRLRLDLLGARVVFIARSTISGNMRLPIDVAALPLWQARTLQIEETVQQDNLKELMVYFLNGRRQYPGSTRLIKGATGDEHDVDGLRRENLEIGDRLLRDVIDGDPCILNRQPTLERSSMGAHYAKVLRDPSVHTIQINVSACDNYGADFDGDQMNLVAPLGAAARVEAEYNSHISNWLISTKSAGVVNGEVQDSVYGLSQLTRDEVVMDKFHAMALFRYVGEAGVEVPSLVGDAATRYTGRQMISKMLAWTPINYSRPPTSFSNVYAPYLRYSDSERNVEIEEGELKIGVIDKRAVGAKSSGGIFHKIQRAFGAKRALAQIFAFQQMSIEFLEQVGASVGTYDLPLLPAARRESRGLIASALLASELITQRLIAGDITPPIGVTRHEYYEKMQIEALKVDDGARVKCILESILPRTNGLFGMISAGSKGSVPNMLHIMVNIDQVTINSDRIGEQFGFRRTLPYFERFATTPFAYGYVANSYVSGMDTTEFIFNGMNGRFDLINKALSTSRTGHFMRLGIMGMQSALVDNFRRVMKHDKIVQLLYGEDGIDTRTLIPIKLHTIALGDQALRARVGVDVAALYPGDAAAAEAQKVVDAAYEEIRQDRDHYRAAGLRLENCDFNRPMSDDVMLPVDIRGLVADVGVTARRANAEPPQDGAAGLRRRIMRVAELADVFPYLLLNEFQERQRAPLPDYLVAAVTLMRLQVRAELAPAVVARLTDQQLTAIIATIRYSYVNSLIAYGVAAGTLAVQSISEPLTQYMLDSHHRSVSGGTNKSGIQRVHEIYGARPVEEEQSPHMLLRLKPELELVNSFARAQSVANNIEYLTFERFVRQYHMLYEPFAEQRYPPFAGDSKWIAEFAQNHPLMRAPGDLTNWSFRIVLDRSMMVLKGVSLETLAERLRAVRPYTHVVHTPESAPVIVMRVYLHAFRKAIRGDPEAYVKALYQEIMATPIRGIEGIRAAEVTKITRHRIGADNALERNSDIYAISTVGTNIAGVMLNSAIDSRRIVSSSVGDSLRMYGLTAARKKIISETASFVESTCRTHITIYADEMSRVGRVTALERGGLAVREKNNMLLRMAQGDPLRVITEGVTNGTLCAVSGIAAPRILGATPEIGTRWNQMVVDEDFVAKNTKSIDTILDQL
jgi:DNA-directed RNA polymerase II subunit RPB1